MGEGTLVYILAIGASEGFSVSCWCGTIGPVCRHREIFVLILWEIILFLLIVVVLNYRSNVMSARLT